MPQMPVVRTPISMRSFAAAMIRALRSSGVTPTKEACGVFWAQYALETGAGGFCWNHNLFNHKVTKAMAANGVPYMMLANTWEIVKGKKETYQPPHPATWFRSFASFEDAMAHHIKAIQKGRYASSWPAMLAGDPELYATKIRERGYYTAPLASYVALMRAKFGPWMKATAYEEALREVLASSEAETVPALPDDPDDEVTDVIPVPEMREPPSRDRVHIVRENREMIDELVKGRREVVLGELDDPDDAA